MYYTIKKVRARCVGSQTFKKEYENNGLKKTYTNTFVNLVYEDKENQYVNGLCVGSYKLKDDSVSKIEDAMYDVDLMIIVSDEGKRQISVSKMVKLEK